MIVAFLQAVCGAIHYNSAMTKWIVLAVASAFLAPGHPQQNPDEGKPYAEAMKKVSFMLGEWEGTGWVQMGQTRSTYDVRESVHLRAGGTVISFQGIGTDPKTGKVGHDAFGVMSYDMEKKAYNIRSYVMNGRSGNFDARVGDKTIIWEIPSEQRSVRYSISIDAEGRWVEKGEVKLDGDRWLQFMEMKLKKMPEKTN